MDFFRPDPMFMKQAKYPLKISLVRAPSGVALMHHVRYGIISPQVFHHLGSRPRGLQKGIKKAQRAIENIQRNMTALPRNQGSGRAVSIGRGYLKSFAHVSGVL